MEAKAYIRQYEQLINQKPQDIIGKRKVEMEWIRLYKDMKGAMRKMSKKQKIELQKFHEKTAKQMHILSADLFKSVTQKGNFKEILKYNEKIYFQLGAKALIDLSLKKDNKTTTFDEEIKKVREAESLKMKPFEVWKEEVTKTLQKKYSSLSEAYSVENELIQHFSWWNLQPKEREISEEQNGLHANLCLAHKELINFLLRELGFSSTFDDCFKTKNQKNSVRAHGLLKAISLFDNKVNVDATLLKEITEKIKITLPSETFKHVRKQQRHFVLHMGPTNSGKTYHAIEALKKATSGVYLAPIRLLALEIQEKLNDSEVPCTLKTGEEVVQVEGAKHQSMVIEMLPFKEKFDVAVIDEIQMIEDTSRGHAWLRTLFGLQANEIHVCGAQHALPFLLQLIKECGDTFEIHHYERQTPLLVEEEHYSFPHGTKKGDALIVFSKYQVLTKAEELKKAGYKVSILYGKLPPDTRKEQARLFISGETDVLVTTDVIGIGLNLPIERIVFLETEKFDGIVKRSLTTQEVKQIAGRAGRKGLYEKGYVNTTGNKPFIVEKLNEHEEDITESVIYPSQEFFDLNIGTLRQRFAAWEKVKLNVPYLKKADVTNELILLKQIERDDHLLEKEKLKKTLHLSFDAQNYTLLKLWKLYVEEMKAGKSMLTKPRLKTNHLSDLETYYHQLALYFTFSRKLHFHYDGTWMKREKERTIHSINRSMSAIKC